MSKLTPVIINELERISRDEAPVKLEHAHLAELCDAWRRQVGVYRYSSSTEIEEIKP